MNKESVTLDIFRRLQAAAAAGNATLKKAAFIGFGDGGHNPDNTIKPFDSTREAMFNRLLVKPLDSLTQPDLYIARAKATATGAELPVVSEAALYDEDMRIMCMAVFSPKYTGVGETYGVTLQVRF